MGRRTRKGRRKEEEEEAEGRGGSRAGGEGESDPCLLIPAVLVELDDHIQ